MKKEHLLIEIEKCYSFKQELSTIIENFNKIIILGNGGSSSIASHISQDYTKKMNKTCFTFSDPSRLTGYSNDYGYENAYKQFLSEFATKDYLVILISSSGNSQNILNCAQWCEDYKIKTVTLSGFDNQNKLNTMDMKIRLLGYWVGSHDYGIVECAHMVFLHMVVE